MIDADGVDLEEFLRPDSRMVQDFYRRRSLSISDLDSSLGTLETYVPGTSYRLIAVVNGSPGIHLTRNELKHEHDCANILEVESTQSHLGHSDAVESSSLSSKDIEHSWIEGSQISPTDDPQLLKHGTDHWPRIPDFASVVSSVTSGSRKLSNSEESRFRSQEYTLPGKIKHWIDPNRCDEPVVLTVPAVKLAKPTIHGATIHKEVFVHSNTASFSSVPTHDLAVTGLGESAHIEFVPVAYPSPTVLIICPTPCEPREHLYKAQHSEAKDIFGTLDHVTEDEKAKIVSDLFKNSTFSQNFDYQEVFCSDEDATSCAHMPEIAPASGQVATIVTENPAETLSLDDPLTIVDCQAARISSPATTPFMLTDILDHNTSSLFSGKRKHNSVSNSQECKRARRISDKSTTSSDTKETISNPSCSHISSSGTVRHYSPGPASLGQYPGRFSISLLKPRAHHKPANCKEIFGLASHPNGRIINDAFSEDNRMHVTSYTDSELTKNPALAITLQRAERKALDPDVTAEARTSRQSVLRRETHRECALARLEGVPVGYYRYFAGHMTVEDYLAAKMCICWGQCYCNKLCTRFGDLLCPCSDDLTVGVEDA
ncbi:hypothetical protein LTS08_003817 [Lithohypha guttulata]|nr:hypothetical protein LTS08_003817 [Lithohypha guttulata]